MHGEKKKAQSIIYLFNTVGNHIKQHTLKLFPPFSNVANKECRQA